MKCLRKYQWVKLPRDIPDMGKGLMAYWAMLAFRAAFRKGNASYCGHSNPVAPGMWAGGVVGLKSILGVRSRTKALQILGELSSLGFLKYSLDSQTKKLTYEITDWVVKCSGAECMSGTVYASTGYGFLCLPRNITQRLANAKRVFDEADAWLDLWCHTTYEDYGNAFSFLAPVVQYGRFGSVLTLETLGERWGWEKTKVWRLLTFLSYVGEYPLCSLQLFGSKEVWRKLIHKHSQRQEYRIPGHADKIICRLLLITGKGKSKSVRLSKGGQNILEIVNPNAALYYTQNYLRHNHAGEAKRLDRFHRVAESAALINLAGFETCPYRLPQLQMVTIRKVVTDAPSFYISKELKYVGDDDVNKTSFSRITGALFCPGGCYAVYNSRDYLMNWNGRGEAKVRLHLTEIARMNADVDDVQSAILLGTGYEIAAELG